MIRIFMHYLRRGYGTRLSFRLARNRMRESS